MPAGDGSGGAAACRRCRRLGGLPGVAGGAGAEHHGDAERVPGLQDVQQVPVGDEGVRRDQRAGVDHAARPRRRANVDARPRRRPVAGGHQERAPPPRHPRLLRPEEDPWPPRRRHDDRHALPGRWGRRRQDGQRQDLHPGHRQDRLRVRQPGGKVRGHHGQGHQADAVQALHHGDLGAHRVRRPVRHAVGDQPDEAAGEGRVQAVRVAHHQHRRAQDVRGCHGQGAHPVRAQRRRVRRQGRPRRQEDAQRRPRHAPQVPRAAVVQPQADAQDGVARHAHAGVHRVGEVQHHGGHAGRRRDAQHGRRQVPRGGHRHRRHAGVRAHGGQPPHAGRALRRRAGGGPEPGRRGARPVAVGRGRVSAGAAAGRRAVEAGGSQGNEGVVRRRVAVSSARRISRGRVFLRAALSTSFFFPFFHVQCR